MINMLAITSVVYLVGSAFLVLHAFAPHSIGPVLIVMAFIAIAVLATRALLREER